MIRRCLRRNSPHRSALSGARFGLLSTVGFQCEPWGSIRWIRFCSIGIDLSAKSNRVCRAKPCSFGAVPPTMPTKTRPMGVIERAAFRDRRGAWLVGAGRVLERYRWIQPLENGDIGVSTEKASEPGGLNHPDVAAASHAKPHSATNCGPQCVRCNR